MRRGRSGSRCQSDHCCGASQRCASTGPARTLGATDTVVSDVSDPVAAILDFTAGAGVDTVIDVAARATEPVTYHETSCGPTARLFSPA